MAKIQEVLGYDETALAHYVIAKEDKAESGYYHLRVDVRADRQVEGEDEEACQYSRQYNKEGFSHTGLAE